MPTQLRARIAQALKRLTNGDLSNLLLGLADGFDDVRITLETLLDIDHSTAELIAEAKLAIAKATFVPGHQINCNFAYDYDAYERIGWCFAQLIAGGQLHEAMTLSENFARSGSHQIEMSDEGLMTDDIVECLKVVATALSKSDVPATEQAAWLDRLDRADAVGVLCDDLRKIIGKPRTPPKVADAGAAAKKPSARSGKSQRSTARRTRRP